MYAEHAQSRWKKISETQGDSSASEEISHEEMRPEEALGPERFRETPGGWWIEKGTGKAISGKECMLFKKGKWNTQVLDGLVEWRTGNVSEQDFIFVHFKTRPES